MRIEKKWIISTLNKSRLFEIIPSSDGRTKLYGMEAELIKTIMAKIGVDYEIITPEDGQYGIELSSGNRTGVIGMLYRGEADIGIANLGILEDRFRTVDFILPSEGKIVENYRELSEAVAKASHRAYTLNGTNHAAFLRHYLEPYLQSLGKIIEENHWHITADEMTQDPLKTKYFPDGKPKIDAVLGAKYIFKMLYEVGDFKSKVFISEDRSGWGSMGIAFRKGFCCVPEVNKYVKKLYKQEFMTNF
ncbi:hypothetical protein TNCV_682501 [Trichonephila clavipes]|nr:hypothetical protein TNCV_682501 [Trichonephila clavipes]